MSKQHPFTEQMNSYMCVDDSPLGGHIAVTVSVHMYVRVVVEVLGASTRVGHRSVHTAFLHVVTPGYYVGVMLAI